jgi:hypothetical protein
MPGAPLIPAGCIIVPFIDLWDLTRQALDDAGVQLNSDVKVLAVDNGSGPQVRAQADLWAQQDYRRRVVLHWDPPMPSLARCWNETLDFAWRMGFEDALVINNDVRMGNWIYQDLRTLARRHDLWFVTPVNCRDSGANEWQRRIDPLPFSFGGPDFSCFLLTKRGHHEYRFDERFQPAYHEDGDYHRRMWLGGHGERIAGAAIPYLHYGSATIKRTPEAAAAFGGPFSQCQQRYIDKWGGVPHHERKITPDSSEDLDGVGTPGGYLGAVAPPRRDDAGLAGPGEQEY